eukprot:681821-Prorocentrum_minimum.AAC.1
MDTADDHQLEQYHPTNMQYPGWLCFVGASRNILVRQRRTVQYSTSRNSVEMLEALRDDRGSCRDDRGSCRDARGSLARTDERPRLKDLGSVGQFAVGDDRGS